ncbi:MAG: tetratricopeptide repeat protein, partial [Actinomycetia bacterium]|nr:tetratricopeptide repeat protein [Actinomycetes bacterium]
LAALLIGSSRVEEGIGLLERIPESPETRRLAALARTGDTTTEDVDAKLATLLASVKVDDEARQEFVDLLELLGVDDPRTADWRRKLSAALF